MRKKIFIPQPVAFEGESYLIEMGYEIVRGSRRFDKESLKKDIKDCDAMLLRTIAIDEEILKAGKKLKIIARHGAGYDNLDWHSANRLGIQTTYSPDTTGPSVAEFTISSILALAKQIELFQKELRKGHFDCKYTYKGMDVAGKTLGIVGFGRIGSLTAKKAAQGLNMNILTFVPRPAGKSVPDYVKMVDWKTLFKESDFISIHVPGGEKNHHLIGKREFTYMKKTAYLINVSRGGVMDEDAFADAVRNGEIAGGAIDVFGMEPPEVNSSLFALDHVMLTPHIGSNTAECMARIALDAVEDIHLVLSGKQPRHPIVS